MKNKLDFLIVFFLVFTGAKAQSLDSLTVYYYENYPYAYMEGTKLKGIEIEIVDEYVNWLKQKKNIQTAINYKPYKEFSSFYASVKGGSPYVIGLGSVTISKTREKDVLFSPPYLQNLAVLITDGRVQTVREKTSLEVSKTLAGLSAVVVNNSSHINYLNDIKKLFVPALKIDYTETQSSVLENIATNMKIFGYVDIVAYWSYLKLNPNKFLKIQKVFNEPKESLGFVMPRISAHSPYINEFFESGFGFTSTKTYHQILEKYLGHEIIESVEIR